MEKIKLYNQFSNKRKKPCDEELARLTLERIACKLWMEKFIWNEFLWPVLYTMRLKLRVIAQ